MRSQNSDLESITNTMERVVREKSNDTTSNLAIFRWRRKNNSRQKRENEELVDTEAMDHEHPSSSRVSFGFFKNIKKCLHLKKLYKSKRKNREMVNPANTNLNTFGYISVIRIFYPPQYQESSDEPEILSNRQILNENRTDNESEDDVSRENLDYPNIRDDEIESRPCPSNVIPDACNAMLATDAIFDMNKLLHNGSTKVRLIEDLLYLSKCGWYWGSISGWEASIILKSEPNGAFLVRDSPDYRYLLTVSFKLCDETMHIGMEHNSSLFSICGQRPDNKRNFSLSALINHSINYIRFDNISWFSNDYRFNHYPPFPFGLTKPICRFSRLKSLQYLCTFVICLNTNLEHIDMLPLPNSIKKYIYEIYVKYVYEI